MKPSLLQGELEASESIDNKSLKERLKAYLQRLLRIRPKLVLISGRDGGARPMVIW